MRTADFPPLAWSRAPSYSSPGATPGRMVLDAERLRAMAREEEGSGSFHNSPDGTFARAPLFIDDLPASFYRVKAGHPDLTPTVNSSSRETLVVLEGALRIISTAGSYDDGHSAAERAFLEAGGVVELEDEPVSLQSVYLMDPAACLAIGMYRDMDQGLKREIKVV